MTQIKWGGKWVHLAYIWIVSHLSAKNYRNLWKFDKVLTKTNLLSFFWDTVYIINLLKSLYIRDAECRAISLQNPSFLSALISAYTDHVSALHLDLLQFICSQWSNCEGTQGNSVPLLFWAGERCSPTYMTAVGGRGGTRYYVWIYSSINISQDKLYHTSIYQETSKKCISLECFVIIKCTQFDQLIPRKIIKIVATRC